MCATNCLVSHVVVLCPGRVLHDAVSDWLNPRRSEADVGEEDDTLSDENQQIHPIFINFL